MNAAQEELARVEKIVEDYQTKKGISSIKVKNGVDLYINMGKAELKTLSREECAEACVILTNYAAYLQEVYNKEVARANWAESEIKRILASQTKQYYAPSHEERKAMAIKDNEYASALSKVKTWAQNVADRLSFMAHRIDAIAKAYQQLSQAKRNYDRQ
jgi:hypothetical protein